MKHIIRFGYEDFLLPEGFDITTAIDLLSGMIKVKSEYVDNKYIYTPHKDKDKEFDIKIVKDDLVREMTEEEEENKELKELKNREKYLEGELKERNEKVKQLECEKKALCDAQEESEMANI